MYSIHLYGFILSSAQVTTHWHIYLRAFRSANHDYDLIKITYFSEISFSLRDVHSEADKKGSDTSGQNLTLESSSNYQFLSQYQCFYVHCPFSQLHTNRQVLEVRVVLRRRQDSHIKSQQSDSTGQAKTAHFQPRTLFPCVGNGGPAVSLSLSPLRKPIKGGPIKGRSPPHGLVYIGEHKFSL